MRCRRRIKWQAFVFADVRNEETNIRLCRHAWSYTHSLVKCVITGNMVCLSKAKTKEKTWTPCSLLERPPPPVEPHSSNSHLYPNKFEELVSVTLIFLCAELFLQPLAPVTTRIFLQTKH